MGIVPTAMDHAMRQSGLWLKLRCTTPCSAATTSLLTSAVKYANTAASVPQLDHRGKRRAWIVPSREKWGTTRR